MEELERRSTACLVVLLDNRAKEDAMQEKCSGFYDGGLVQAYGMAHAAMIRLESLLSGPSPYIDDDLD